MASELSNNPWFKHFKKTDPLAAAQLALLMTHESMEVTQDVHLSILKKIRAGDWLTSGTRLIYRGIKLFPKAGQALINPVVKHVHRNTNTADSDTTTERMQVVAALNGVFGHQFIALHNPLAINMTLIRPVMEQHRHKILLINGLCMDESAWPTSIKELLASRLNADIWLLRYNSGISMKENAEALLPLLKRHLQADERLTIIGHSMGGLIATLALIQAEQTHQSFAVQVKALVTLGSPFNGAPLAQWGHWIEQRLAQFSFTLPFTRITNRRSQGILELRHGIEKDLPSHLNVPCYCIAAELSTNMHPALDDKVGDGLVTTESALALPFATETLTVKNTGHLKLLKNQEAYDWLIEQLNIEHK